MATQKRPDFHRAIMQSKQLRLPKFYAKNYWNGTPNPIFLILPNDRESKEGPKETVELSDESLNEVEELAQTRRRQINKSKRKVDSDLNTAQPKISDEVAGSKEGVKGTRELRDESLDESEQHKQTERRKNNKRKRKVATQPKISGRKRKDIVKEVNNNSPYFEVTLKPSYAKGYMLRIPIVFTRKYFRKSERKAMLKFENDMAMEVIIEYNNYNGGFSMKRGWKKFTDKYNLKIGDVCKFVITSDQPLSFSVTFTRVRKEKKLKKFLGVSLSDSTVAKKKSVGETSRGRPKGSKSCNVINSSFKLFVNCLYPKFPKKFMDGPKKIVKLKMKEESWLVKVNYYHSIQGWRFSGGWLKFRKDCMVEIGDTCLFELTDNKNMVFDVSFVEKNT
ncbi:B3 domain-containing protein At5g18000-like [Vicia villosa]|uniref:B3 domain-containing protein At5g18000-like n=1 Tax=Vicia villosa TaxID=3911 RepID=UPI00273B0D33|nr:B3 domain-containing protein At5g18000-like [Vicia villosa]